MMTYSRIAKKALFSVLTVTLLASCLGTNPKTLGTKTEGGTGNAVTDSDSFSISLAYRADSNPDDGRLVQLQGVRGVESANLVNLCGAEGASCTCDFYKSATDTAPATSSTVGISADNNSFSCTIAGSTDPDEYKKVRIRTTNNSKITGFIDIKTTLTLTDVLGSLVKTKVNKIYRYGCTRLFFEGEGVTPSAITCVANQRLGLITATYNFYLYQSSLGSNFNLKTTDVGFDEAICGRTSHLKISCTASSPDLRYGLYSELAAPFTVAISLTAAPIGDNTNAINGYAALPDTSGNCPTGLVKIRPWIAQPPSIVSGSLGSNPPSQFVNSGTNLMNTIVELNSQPDPFLVTRQPNQTACANNTNADNCSGASFGGSTTPHSVAYTALAPVVCAIPKELLSGI